MKISAKARYGLAALVSMASSNSPNECVTIISLSQKLQISKIYLEQVFSLLKHGGIVISMKGAQGGYHLARAPKDISVYDIFSAIETTLFQKVEDTVTKSDESIENAMQETVFHVLDSSIKEILMKIPLADIVSNAEAHRDYGGYMYYL